MNKSGKRLILLELNEINFDVVDQYLAKDSARFPSLKKLLAGASIRTSCEKKYEELEPWIQWVSVHTNKTYAEHGVFAWVTSWVQAFLKYLSNWNRLGTKLAPYQQ